MNPEPNQNRGPQSECTSLTGGDAPRLPARSLEVGDRCEGKVKAFIEGGVLLVIGSGVVRFLTDKHADIRNSAIKAKEVLRIGDKIPVILSEVRERSDGKLSIL